jgi:hypothetical protein
LTIVYQKSQVEAAVEEHVRPFETAGSDMSDSTATEFLQILVPLLKQGKGSNGATILQPDTVKAMFEDQMPILGIKDLGGLAVNGTVATTDTIISGAGLEML